MTIGIDASRPNEPQKTGTEWYAYHIIEELKKIDQKNNYVLYSYDSLRDGLQDLPSNFKSRVLTSITDILWTQLRLSIEMLTSPPDILFVPAHTIPLIHPKTTVLTVHDLGFEYFPELYKQIPIGPKRLRWFLEIGARLVSLGRYGNSEYDYHRWAMRFGIKHAARIIAVSEYTKQDVIKRFGADQTRITVATHGYDRNLYRPIRNGEHPKSSRLLKLRPYILYVGRVERKKNIAGLLTAYKIFRESTTFKHKLVLIGKPALGFDEIQKQIENFPAEIRADIHFIGWTPEEEKTEFLRHADLFVFPSFFEGFGIPVIEAMASGVPVICSNVTSLPEIAGDAAVLIDPHKPEEIAAAMKQVLEDKRLRQSLIARGIKQAKKFSWQESARTTLKVIEEAYENRARS